MLRSISLGSLARSLTRWRHIIFIYRASVHAKSLSKFKTAKQAKCHASRAVLQQRAFHQLPPPPSPTRTPSCFCSIWQILANQRAKQPPRAASLQPFHQEARRADVYAVIICRAATVSCRKCEK